MRQDDWDGTGDGAVNADSPGTLGALRRQVAKIFELNLHGAGLSTITWPNADGRMVALGQSRLMLYVKRSVGVVGVKTVQARLRHASAKTTLDTYRHIWPDRDESTRAAVDAVLTAYQTEQRHGGS